MKRTGFVIFCFGLIILCLPLGLAAEMSADRAVLFMQQANDAKFWQFGLLLLLLGTALGLLSNPFGE